jgi:hypothetical protein
MSCHLNNAPSSTLQCRCRSFFDFICSREGTCGMAQTVDPSADDVITFSLLDPHLSGGESPGA